MNHGPFIFLGVLATFVASWWGLVFAPYVQIGSQQAALTDTGGLYPNMRPGAASQGRQVYVASGCVQCHSQQIQQEGYTFDLVLTVAGTNPPRVARVIKQIAPDAKTDELLAKASDRSPQTILTNVPQLRAEDEQKALKKAGATAQAVFIPLGADLGPGRHWGVRRTVGADYLCDDPVQVGNSRLGPDLSNYGNRAPEADLILKHLYDPRTTMPGSVMPAYRYLFEIRAVGKRPSPNALNLAGEFAPKAGEEVVPTTEALQLVAYLQSLRADTPLLEGPMTQIGVPSAPRGDECSGHERARGRSEAMNEVENNLREDAEPTVRQGAVYLPMWIIGLLGLLIYWGFNYVDAHGGDYQQLVYEPYQSTNQLYGFIPKDEIGDLMKIGRQKYGDICAPCHQAHGGGNAGQAPPLAGSSWVLAQGPNRLIRIPQCGVTGPIMVNGTEWNLPSMINFGAGLTDEQLAGVLTYIRKSWGNNAPPVLPEQVAKVRAELKCDGQLTVPELEKLPEAIP